MGENRRIAGERERVTYTCVVVCFVTPSSINQRGINIKIPLRNPYVLDSFIPFQTIWLGIHKLVYLSHL